MANYQSTQKLRGLFESDDEKKKKEGQVTVSSPAASVDYSRADNSASALKDAFKDFGQSAPSRQPKAEQAAPVVEEVKPRQTGEYRGNFFQKLGQSYFDVIKSVPVQTARGVGMIFNAPNKVAEVGSDLLMKNDSYRQYMEDAARGIDLGKGRAAIGVLNTGALGIGDLKPILNTKVGQEIVTNVADKTSNLPIKAVAGLRAIGEGTYKEYRDAMIADRNNPENGNVKKFLYELQDSGVQSLVGILLTTGTVLATRNPKAGYAIGGAYYGSLSAAEQIQSEGEVKSSGNIYIDVIGDSLINNALLGVFKMPASAITRVLATGGLEGSTEVVQSLLKFSNSYTQAKTDAERQDIMEDAVNYVKSGAILMEFGVGAVVGAGAQGGVEVLNTAATSKTRTDVKNSFAFDIEAAIEAGDVDPATIYQNGQDGTLTAKFAEGRINDVAQKLGKLDPTLETQYRNSVDVNNATMEGIISTGETILDTYNAPTAAGAEEVLNTAGSKKTEEATDNKVSGDVYKDIETIADLIARADSGQELSTSEQTALVQARQSFIDYSNAFQATTVSIPNQIAPNEPPIAQIQVVDVGDKVAVKYSADAGETALIIDYDLNTLYSSPEAATKAAIDSIAAFIESQKSNPNISPVAQSRFEDIMQQLRPPKKQAAIKVPKKPADVAAPVETAPTVGGFALGTQVNFAGRSRKVTAIIPFAGETKYQLTDEKGNYIYTNEGGMQTAVEATELGITEEEVLKRRNEENGTPKKSQKDKVKEVIDEKGEASIKDIADITGILEPNIRRILGTGAKSGEFERVDAGVYRLKVDGKDVAFVMAADAVETLPKLAAQGFKADMVFLDIPYETKAVKGGNRGVNYDFLSVDDFKKVVTAIKTIARDENTPVIHMYSQAESGMKEMTAYNEVFPELGFKPVAKGEWQKTYKDGSPVAFPTRNGSMVTKPEGILVFTLSGETDKQLESLQFKTVRPKGYQTEKAEEMLKAMIEMTTEEGDVVFDPFAGSGSTAAAAVKAGRKTVAIEKNAEVVETVTKPRIENAVKQKRAVLPSTKKKEAEQSTVVEEQDDDTDNAIEEMVNAIKERYPDGVDLLHQTSEDNKKAIYSSGFNGDKNDEVYFSLGSIDPNRYTASDNKTVVQVKLKPSDYALIGIDRGTYEGDSEAAQYRSLTKAIKEDGIALDVTMLAEDATRLMVRTEPIKSPLKPKQQKRMEENRKKTIAAAAQEETAIATATKLIAEGKPEKAEKVLTNADTLTIVPDDLETQIETYVKEMGSPVFEPQAKKKAKETKKLASGEVPRPDTKVKKTGLKDLLAGQDRIVFTVLEENDTMYLYSKTDTNETYLRPSALGLVEEGLNIGQEVVLDATELKATGSYLNAVNSKGDVLAEGLFKTKYDPKKHESYFVDYRPNGFSGNQYIFAIPKGQGAFYKRIIDDARTKSGRLATGHQDVNGKGIWHLTSTPYSRMIDAGVTYKGEVNNRIKQQLETNKKALLASYKSKTNEFAEEIQPKSRKSIRTTAQTEFAEVSKRVQKAEPAGKRPSSFASREPQTESKVGDVAMNKEELRKGSEVEYDKLVKRSEIARVLTTKLGAVVRTGKFRQAALGIYKQNTDTIRMSNKNFSTREGGQLTTLVHELGHYMDYSIQKYRNVIPKNEIAPLLENYGAGAASVPANKKRSEAFAEFLRYYITIPAEAQSRAPEFYKYFVNSLEAMPEIRDAVNGAQTEFRRWAEQPATAKVAAQISFEQDTKEGFKTKLNTTINAIYRDAVNDLHAIAQFSEMAKKTSGEILADKDPYILARNMRGWIGRAQYFLESGTVRRDYWKKGDNGRFYVEKKGKGLKEILQPVENKGALNDLSVYLVSRRALELAERDITSGVTPEDAKVALAELGEKHPEFSQVALDLDSYQNDLLDYLQESGVLNKDDRAAMQEANKMYVPFFRVHEELTNKGYMGGKKIPTKSPIKRIKGSEKDIIDPLESIVKNTYVLINAAERNNVMQAMANLANNDKNLGRLFERVPEDMGKVASVNAKEIVYEALGAKSETDRMFLPATVQQAIDIIVPDTMVNIFRPAMFQKGNVVAVMEDGKPKYYELEKDLYEAINATEVEEVIAAVKILSYPAQFLRAGATLAPEFMVRNPLRDSIGAAVVSKNGFVPFYDTIRGFASLVKKDEYYDAFVLSGGLQSTIIAQDRTNLKQSKDELLKRSARIKKLVKNPLEVLQILSSYTEQATRIGEARLALNAGKSATQAAFDAREVTLDFQRAGAKTRSINKLSAFFNAKIQGNDKLVRAFIDNPAKATLKATMYITLPSVILWLLNQDEEGWDEIPQWQKDIFWLVHINGTWYRIPKPFELGVLFGSIPERFLEYLKDNDPEGLQEITRAFITGLIPNPIPTGVVPILENTTNYSFFLDRPIVSPSLENLPNADQYTNTTSETSKLIGEAINYSPAKIDNLLYGYFAGLGRHTVDAADAILKGTGIVNSVTEPAKTKADIPVLKAFVVRDPAGSSSNSVNDFYENRTEATKFYNKYKNLLEEGRADEAREYLVDHPEIKLYKPYNQISSQISDLRQLSNQVYESETLTAEEKRVKIDELNRLITDTAYRANNIELQ